MKTKKIILILIFIILLIILLNIIITIPGKIKMMKEHKDYFNLPTGEKKIESWMTLRMIEHEFKIDVSKELGQEKNQFDGKLTLDEYCIKKNLNLNETISKLEKAKNEKQNLKNKKIENQNKND